MDKLYMIEFLSYTNYSKDCVSDYDYTGLYDPGKTKYISCKYPFIVKEADLDYYKKFGYGFMSIKFIGELHTPKEDGLE